MKNNKILLLLSLILAVSFSFEAIAQITIDYPNTRTQYLNQYTSVFICSPNSGTIIQNIHNDDSQLTYFNSDKFQEYNNGYIQLPEEFPTTTMQRGKGYVIQIGGNGNYTETRLADRVFNFAGGVANSGTIPVGVTSGQFNLLGNPYSDFLDLDKFLLNSNNATKVTGPIYLWTHNTVISTSNPVDPSDPTSIYRNSANDYALYNVLGGVAAGRQISTSAENGTTAGIQTPNGKICLGTGFGIISIGSGNVLYDDTMKTTTTDIQSFRLTDNTNLQSLEASKTTALTPFVKSRIWLNIESSVIPPGGTFNPLKQILIGYSPCFGADCATVGDSDRVFDAETVTAISQPKIDFYSFAAGSTKHLAIQGRGDFQNTDFFQLGYKVTLAGTYTITSTADGLFSTKPYYILDADDPTGQYHSLPYTFNVNVAGTFNTRFKVVFENLVSITSPANICDSQISDIDTSVFSTLISGATAYKFRVRKNSDTGPILGEFNGPNPANPHVFNLNLPGITTYNTNYWVSVATYQIGGVWQYGPSCKIKTPSLPLPSYINTQCGTTLPSYWFVIRAAQISGLGVAPTNYQFVVTLGANQYTLISANPNFQLPNVPGLPIVANTTYTIRVDVLWNGNLILGATTCNITTPNTPPRQSQNGISIFEASTYPNPFNDNFKLDINTSSEKEIQLLVYDMLGRQIENHNFDMSNLNTLEIGNNYASGVYNLILKQGENTKTLRVIKR